jgi:ribosomal protein S10
LPSAAPSHVPTYLPTPMPTPVPTPLPSRQPTPLPTQCEAVAVTFTTDVYYSRRSEFNSTQRLFRAVSDELYHTRNHFDKIDEMVCVLFLTV